MIQPSDQTLETLLVQAGFKQNDRQVPGLIGPSEVNDDPDIYFRYGPLLDPAAGGERLSNLVYEVPSNIDGVGGTPCICFSVLDEATPAAINAVRMRVWNHGRIPTLWVISPGSVRIYDSFARPRNEDVENPKNHLLEELRQIGGRLRGIEEFHKSKFDTGEFWQSGKGQDIKQGQRVDSALLRDLLDTKRALESEGLPTGIAQALLGRAIFVKYLEDRRILQPAHFQPYGGHRSFRAMLNDIAGTYRFFDWLRATFNGDLFPVEQDEEEDVSETHLKLLRLFLDGHDMRRYPNLQARLWPYSFETIPIELISSIYEMFAHETNPRAARSASIHYTRLSLVELMLSLAMQGMTHTAKILDPACGSGVFLVEAFRRLARLKERHYLRALTREELHELLTSQIFGMDTDRQAVYVAAFSLYLALLELDPDPQPPDALKFPRLLESQHSNGGPNNLYIQDFFNPQSEFNRNPPFSSNEFDLIIGNPPWTALNSRSPGQLDARPLPNWGIEYCRLNDIPDNKPDQAFAWRAREFSSPQTRIALVVGSRLLYQGSPKAERWRRKFLEANQVVQVVNLSDLKKENLLFGRGSSTSQPASVVTFSPGLPEPQSTVLHIAPKWYPGVRQRDELVINSADIQEIPQVLFREYPVLWKTAFRGSPRDFRLLQRLHSLPTFEEVLLKANVRKRFDRSYGVTFGNNPTKDASELNGLPYLSAGTTRGSFGAAYRYVVPVDDLPPFNRPHIAARSIRRPLPLPALVLHRALRDHRPCAALIEPSKGRDQVVLHRYYGISLARAPKGLGYRLNAILNSELAAYMTFYLSSSVGWEREVVEHQAWLQLPLPPTILDEDDGGAWQGILDREMWLRTHWQRDGNRSENDQVRRTKREVDDEISRLYELSDQERVLIEDSLRYTITPFLQGNEYRATSIFERPTAAQLENYALRLCHQIDGILRQAGMQLAATIVDAGQHGLNACRFDWRRSSDGDRISVANVGGIREVLEQISVSLRASVAERLYVQQDLRVYDDRAFWIIKPSQARLWSETAALNDADAVLREHMDWGSRG